MAKTNKTTNILIKKRGPLQSIMDSDSDSEYQDESEKKIGIFICEKYFEIKYYQITFQKQWMKKYN